MGFQCNGIHLVIEIWELVIIWNLEIGYWNYCG